MVRAGNGHSPPFPETLVPISGLREGLAHPYASPSPFCVRLSALRRPVAVTRVTEQSDRGPWGRTRKSDSLSSYRGGQYRTGIPNGLQGKHMDSIPQTEYSQRPGPADMEPPVCPNGLWQRGVIRHTEQ